MAAKQALVLLCLGFLAAACHDEAPPAQSPATGSSAEPEGSTLEQTHESFKKSVHETADDVDKDLNQAQKKVQKAVKGAGKELGVSPDVLGDQPDGG